MLSLILLLIVLSSGSAYACARFQKRYGEVLPVTCMGAVLVMYCFGAAGFLRTGMYAVCAAAALLWVLAAVRVIRTGERAAIARRFFTGTFVTFAAASVLFCLCLKDAFFISYDEFTHWGECVRIIYRTNAFALWSPRSLFPSYPPGMALFQYLFLKIGALTGEGEFMEWRVIVAYRVFCAALIAGMLERIPARKISHRAACAAVLFIAPLFLYSYYYSLVLIDGFLATAAAAGFAALLTDEDGPFLAVFLSLTCAMLTLTKDSGLFFAAFLAAAYAVRAVFAKKEGKKISLRTLRLALPALAAAAAKLSWSAVVKASGRAVQFSNKVDIIEYTRIFFTRDEEAPRFEVLENFKEALFTPFVRIANTDAAVNYFFLVVAGVLGLYLIFRLIVRGDETGKETGKETAQETGKEMAGRRAAAAVLVVMEILYIYFIGAIYVFNSFTDEEAERLASYDRYMNTVILVVLLCSLAAALCFMFRYHREKAGLFTAVCLSAVLVCSSTLSVKKLLNGDYVKESSEKREEFTDFAERIVEECGEGARVYLIIQGGIGEDYYALRYLTDPVDTELPYGHFSVGKPAYSTDTTTWQCSKEEWLAEAKDYDYVAVYRLNDAFREDFGSAFADPEGPEEEEIYRFDEETGLLR